MTSPNYYPVYLSLEKKRVLIVGGGAVAVEKLVSLLPTGASITVVAPDARKEVSEWHKEGRLTWRKRHFRPEDIADAFMIVAATEDPGLNAEVYRLGDRANKLTNSVDDPAHCNFITAAVSRCGPLQVAVSSAGTSPALAQRLRDRIAREIVTEDKAILAEFLGEKRPAVKSCLSTYNRRKEFWDRVIDSRLPQVLSTQGKGAAEKLFSDMLRQALAPGDATPIDRRKVYIVGAGPGDPGLITVRAIDLLRNADAVVYDRLVNPILLGYVSPHAECIYLGKEKGVASQMRQGDIHERLINLNREGKLVVRLKGGDPFVFGRGGEEAVALAEAGIEFEVISGVSSAIAAAVAANIPVTHRGVSASFAVFAGHVADGQTTDSISWRAAAEISTAVFLMGVERLPHIVERLVAEGRDVETPVAIISNATLSCQAVVTGTLSSIVSQSGMVCSPAVIVVGEVVRLRKHLEGLIASRFAGVGP